MELKSGELVFLLRVRRRMIQMSLVLLIETVVLLTDAVVLLINEVIIGRICQMLL